MQGHVWFIGAGPGDPELLTLKARAIIERAGLVLYAGSLVPPEAVACAREDARVVDSAPLDLEHTHALMLEAARAGQEVARVHTGDPSLYGAVQEQAELLTRDGVPWSVVPGVTAAFAAAAEAGRSFTVPAGTQTLMVTRLEGRTPVPESEELSRLAAHGAAMAIYLSAGDPEGVQRALLAGGMGPDTLVCMAHRVGWEGQRLAECALSEMAATARANDFTRQTVFLVLPGASADQGRAAGRSLLYDKAFTHMFRQGSD